MHTPSQVKFFHRGPHPVVRLIFLMLLSVGIMLVDSHFNYLESVRKTLSVLIAPIQQTAILPREAWQDTESFFVSQGDLATENTVLKKKLEQQSIQLIQLAALKSENEHLRTLHQLKSQGQLVAQVAEIIYAERDIFKRKILVNKGSVSKIKLGQVVLDEQGIIGQVTRIYPLVSEITLVTERNQAVPVQVLRNGLRTVIFGAGDASHMSLRYMPINSDIQAGDVLISSGIDGIYPFGIPVAKVLRVERDAAYPFAKIICAPLGSVDNHRHVMILSELPPLPPRPEPEQTIVPQE